MGRANSKRRVLIATRVSPSLAKWVDQQAEHAEVSRSQWLALALESMRKFQSAAQSSGLFDDFEGAMERSLARALQSLPAPDLERLLDSKRGKR